MIFSVVMPVYNAGAYLEKSVRSVVAQSMSDWELLLADDGSTDGAVDALRVRDPRIRVLRQPHGGAAAASNAALEEARGRYVAILDQDDDWSPTKLARHLDSFTHRPDIDFNFTWSHFIGPDDEMLPLPRRTWRGRVSLAQLARDFVIGATSSVAFRREAATRINGFDTSFECMYDLDLILRLAALRPDNGIAIEEDLCAYRRHPAQMSRNWRLMHADWTRLLTGLLTTTDRVTADDRRCGHRNMLRYFSYLAYESYESREALRLWWASITTAPGPALLDLRTWKLGGAIAAGALWRAGRRSGVDITRNRRVA